MFPRLNGRLLYLALALTLAAIQGWSSVVQGSDFPAFHSHDPGTGTHHQPGSTTLCTCETARLENGWCNKCRTGYAATMRIPSAALFEFIDTNGHEIDLGKSTCTICPRALASDGYCRKSKIGFVDGRAYVSRLSYLLAKGRQVGLDDLDCRVCESHFMDTGWCTQCRRGIVGNVSYSTRFTFGHAVMEFRRLRTAVGELETCEFCGIALFSSGRCSKCNIFYRAGRRVSAGNSGFPGSKPGGKR